MAQPIAIPDVDIDTLRAEISKEYGEVATNPGRGFHFHTGRPLAKLLGYPDKIINRVPAKSLESFAGTGNPFSLGEFRQGERVVDLGCGAGIDSIIASHLVGPEGRVIGIDMTTEMLEKARAAAADAGIINVEFRQGHAESPPVEDGWADVVISNGVVNLCPDKMGVFGAMHRMLKPGGRLQIADILVHKPVPDEAKANIDLWKG
ncbi:MAG: methyltransferase domain-containing protein [Dehalococcoidia bacterium]